jgi:hypothetical protein
MEDQRVTAIGVPEETPVAMLQSERRNRVHLATEVAAVLNASTAACASLHLYPHCPHAPTAAAWQRRARADRLAAGGKIERENWRDDLNSLIDETMAFAKSVRVEPPLPRTIVELNRMPSVNWISSEREEIRHRVANFKAHQQRFLREREDFVAAKWKRMRASQHRSDT